MIYLRPRRASNVARERFALSETARGVLEDVDTLLQRVAERDFRAFDAIYEGFHQLVYAVAHQVLHDQNGAEDVTQSVFITVWTSPHRYRGGSFRRWIAAVARNRALDVARAARPDRAFADLERSVNATDSIQDAVITKIEGNRARHALAALPSPQRGPIELSFFGGMTHEQIARRTATPLGTVKSRIRSGLRALRTTLETGAA